MVCYIGSSRKLRADPQSFGCANVAPVVSYKSSSAALTNRARWCSIMHIYATACMQTTRQQQQQHTTLKEDGSRQSSLAFRHDATALFSNAPPKTSLKHCRHCNESAWRPERRRRRHRFRNRLGPKAGSGWCRQLPRVRIDTRLQRGVSVDGSAMKPFHLWTRAPLASIAAGVYCCCCCPS